MIAPDHMYTEEHEWVVLEGGIATIGITDYAQDALGDITFVELPEIGKEVHQFDDLAVIESVKAASDVFAPLSGRVVEVNEALERMPELINQDCYGEGWICKVEDIHDEELHNLLSPEAYAEHIEGAV